MASSSFLDAQIGSSPLDEPVDYRDLKAWIEEQEANPKPLSPLQQRAIAILKRSREPEIGACNWVGLLNTFQQVNGSPSPKFTDEFLPTEKWIVRCHFQVGRDAEVMVFPNPEAGFAVDETGTPAAPSFGRKKDAKQYAVKCCAEWLIQAGYMSSDGVSVEFPKAKKARSLQVTTVKPTTTTTITTTTASPLQSAQPPKPTITSNNTSTSTSNNTAATTTTTPITTVPPTPPKNETKDPPTTQRVADLCRALGLTNPQYRITPAAASATTTPTTTTPATTASQTLPPQKKTPNEFFDGRADFGADSIQVPPGLGTVANVYGKANARERVAEEVCAWLVAEVGRRREQVEELFGGARLVGGE